MSAGLGYLILVLFTVILIGIALRIHKKNALGNVDELLTAGRRVPFGFVAASVFVAWVWTGTIMASAEAGVWFGVSGGFNYGWGAIVPFLVFIPIALRLRKIMPKTTTFIEFVRERYGTKLANVFFVFGVALVLYVCVMQAVGIAYSFEYAFGINYKFIAFVCSILFAGFIAIAGLRGSIYNSLFQFFVIMLVVFITVPFIIKEIGLETIYQGLHSAATDPTNPNYNPDALNFFAPSGLRYGMAAVVIAMGQVVLSQGYYSTAQASASSRNLFWAYLIGTIVAWLPIPIIFGNVIGGSVFALNVSADELAVATGAAPYIFHYFLGNYGSVLFVILIFMAGLTTGGNGLAGVQAMFTIDFYKRYINKKSTEKQQAKFGKYITLLCGVVIGVSAMMLDGVSLLEIDIFSGILFAAPTASLILGLWLPKLNAKVAFLSMVVGLTAGLLAYFMIPDDELNWFVGNILALGLPFVIILASLPFVKQTYDYSKLKDYTPEHEVKTIG
ncbi:Na(+)/glucose symporter [Alkalihalobacillus sp. MEB130]|uniref:sodium:solute symporter family transporter n=1 Tax=Alkalihalobacillus sp. MEB130 TaxID=2976704 RepID=UPI0028E0839A|nr:Na(+)/glucose symporter [Alkalihalobacillus sp. MEB130]MDT8858901.1 Na(+)/glucose symporter [Alkalihalobacillus sp. MEB130]